MLTDLDVLARLRAACAAAGSQKAYAEAIGVHETYLSDVLAQRRQLAGKILDALNLERVVRYQERGAREEES